MAKKKRDDKFDFNEYLNEIRWCVRHRHSHNNRWGWVYRTVAFTRREAIDYYCQEPWRNCDEKKWVFKRKTGLVACVKVKLVEQP